MNGTRLPFFARSKQFSLTLIAVFSCALSFWLTVRFCARLAPTHAALEIVAMGLIWELSKVTFGTMGAHHFAHGGPSQRRSGSVLVAMSVVLAAGSVTASLTYLQQTGDDLSRQALHASQAYQRGTASLVAMDQEIATLQGLADQDARQMFRTRSLRTLDRVSSLRTKREQVISDLARLEGTTDKQEQASAAPLIGATLLACAQCVLAVMLELVGMLAIAFLVPKPRHAAEQLPVDTAPQVQAVDQDQGSDWAATYARARGLVTSSQLRPTYRAMRSALDISQPTALSFLQTMTAEGVLRRVGRHYTLADGAMAGGVA